MITEASRRVSILPPDRISPTLRPRKRSGCASTAARLCGAGAFGHGFLDVQQQRRAVLEIVLAHQQDILHQRAHDLARQHARGLDGDALGDGVAMADAACSPLSAASIDPG